MMSCYVTQFTPDELKEDRKRKLEEPKNTVYFRRFVTQKGLRNRF